MAVRLPEVLNGALPTPTPTPLNSDYSGGSRVSQAWSGLGNTITSGAVAYGEQIDELQAETQLNKLRARELEMTRGENGYLNVRGGDVINTNMIDRFTKEHAGVVAELESELPTEQQRAKFRLRADASGTTFKAGLYSHAAGEIDTYERGTLEGMIDVEASAAASNWNNPTALEASVTRVRSSITAYGVKRGVSPEQSLQETKKALSLVHAGAVSGALENNDLDFAEKYMAANKGEMDVSALSTFGNEIAKRKQAQIVDGVRQEVADMLERVSSPSGFSQLENVVGQIESGNKDFSADGKPLTSPTGAKYRMQVLPSTARDPGFGIRPAADDSPQEYNRVGRELLSKLVEKYDGNTAKALAAYNVGAGSVDRAIAAGGDKWFEKLTTVGPGAIIPPDQVKQVSTYVPKAMKLLNSGGGFQPLPTVTTLKQGVRKRLQGQPEEVIAKAEAAAEAALNDKRAAMSQEFDGAMQEVAALVDAGQLNDPDAIPMDLTQRLGPRLQAAKRYIETEAEKVTEMSGVAVDFYYELRTNREKLMSMSNGEILAMAPDIGRARAKDLVARRETYIADPDLGTTASIDNEQFLTTASRFGYKTTGTDARAKLISIQDRAEEAIIDAEKQLGRKLSRDEKGQVLSRLFTVVRAERDNTGWFHRLTGLGSDRVVEKTPVYKLSGNDTIVVPPEVRAEIQAAAKRQGVTLTERDIREEYVLRLTKAQQGDRK